MVAGYHEEAVAWRDWLLRAVAGRAVEAADHVRRRRRAEPDRATSSTGSAGYESSRPVRVGNAAAGQFQLDVYGEVIVGAARVAPRRDRTPARRGPLEQMLLDFLEDGWRQPDDGIWEVRGPRRHFTHSKVDGVGGDGPGRPRRRGVRPRGTGRPLAPGP